jgi:hypothetical protein
MKKEKGIDDIFKHSLKDPVETEFKESDWDAFENMLDRQKPAGRVFWLPLLGAAAAVVLVFLGWLMFKPEATTTQQQTQQMAGNKPAKTGDQPTAVTPSAQQPQVAVTNEPGKDGNVISKPTKMVKDEQTTTQQNNVARAYTGNSLSKVKQGKVPPGLKYTNKNGVIASMKIAADTARPYIAFEPMMKYDPSSTGEYQGIVASLDIVNLDEKAKADEMASHLSVNRPLAASKVEIKKTTTSSFHPLFAITALASSELNGIGSFNSTSKGTNLGLMFTAGVKKFTLSTGANYSVKPYTVPFSQYPSTYTYKTPPESVTADCRILDIPINIGYQVYNKGSNKITLGTGISSYIMMHESYTYDYPSSAKKVYGPSYYAVQGKGKYLWSIMNLQATYERKINSSVGLSLQPYLKLPLSSIGYSNVRVQTFGVAVGLNWNINSLTKPK